MLNPLKLRGAPRGEGRIAPYTKDGGKRAEERSATRFKSKSRTPTVTQIQQDKLNEMALKYWAPRTLKSHEKFDPKVIKDIYSDLKSTGFPVKRTMMLEFSQYFECYLWPNFEPEKSPPSDEHVLSVVLMINEKIREKVPPWMSFQLHPSAFPSFFRHVLDLCLRPLEDKSISVRERTQLLLFLDHCFTSMEIEIIRDQVQKLISLAMWVCLPERRRELELKRIPKWKKYYKAVNKKIDKMPAEEREKSDFERRFLFRLIENYLAILNSIEVNTASDQEDEIVFVEHFLMLLIDLEALLPTRRFFDTILDASHLIVKSSLSQLAQLEEGRLFLQLLEELRFYQRFEISNETGEQLDDKEALGLHYDRITSLQKAVFSRFPDMKEFALATVASIDDRSNLEKHFKGVEANTLHKIAEFLCLVEEQNTEDMHNDSEAAFLREMLINRHERRDSQLQQLNEMPLYPTESVIWNENIVPGDYYNGEGVLALPKLNLQFLTLQDYLLRNFKLFQLESTYEIRGDIEDIVTRMKPWRPDDDGGNVVFNGWARMAQPISSFSIVEVAKPHIGRKQPSRVRADVTVNLSVRDNIKAEWENLRRHDICFLVTVRPPITTTPLTFDFSEDFVTQTGLLYVRGCEIEGMLDENGRVIEEGPEPRPKLTGEARTYRVLLDTNQYHLDMEHTSQGGEDVYETFNILMRRKPKENNFKGVLETIRDLMNTRFIVPDYLKDVLLGYGDPAAAHYSNMASLKPSEYLDFNDTFLNFEHLRHSFPNHEVRLEGGDSDAKPVPPFKVKFVDSPLDEEDKENFKPYVSCRPYNVPSRGPYPINQPKQNSVPFTPTQVEAVRSGMSPGLTLVVGPPGTGKTDVAVQIINNIYHNNPEQRTVIVTHSNQALNQLFEKIMALDIDERHLLRLGHGEEALETEKDFSRYGRVNYVLAKRLELLERVRRLQKSLDVPGDVSYTCETSAHFYLYEVLSRWERFEAAMRPLLIEKLAVHEIEANFPFKNFFADAPQPLFAGNSFEADYERALSCWRYIEDIFHQLEEFRAFELLRSGLDRTRYLVVKEAKIIAMTCTHAALKRKELAGMGFKFDNILMEEAAQILEIETFIPMLLQNPEDGHNRLKRLIMIGDHHQLPPVIKNMAFQKFSNMEQSLFTRFVRLGVPTVDLDAQGRARPSIASLYNWRYKSLGNLSHVLSQPSFVNANGGFSFDYQLIDVADFKGVGESQPSPFFYQNLAEAEYVVATFMYMRLIGYPAEKISILTTYNGQKHLIRDVVKARCSNNPLVGAPHKITTVDKFQGQQNDFILLSLVRTWNVGHLRDVRRLVVAMSRARLGLYVFGRVNLFRNCFELQPTFNLLLKRPQQLYLCPNETYQTERKANVTAPNPMIIQDMPEMCKFVFDFYAEKVAALQKLVPSKKEIEPTKPDWKVSQHPGVDRDSDDEAEGKSAQQFTEIVNEVPMEQQ